MEFTNSEMLFFYMNTEYKSPVFTMFSEFKKDIDEGKMKEALQKALEVFPRMKVMPVLDENGHVRIVENHNDVPVYRDDGSTKMLGSKDTDYYLFRIILDKNKFRISVFHALGDGYCLTQFINQIFLHYLELTENIDITPFALTKEKTAQSRYSRTLAEKVGEYLTGKTEVDDDGKKDLRKAFFADDEPTLLSTSKTCVQELSWDGAEFSKLVHKYNTTPLVLIHTLLARINLELYDCADEEIKCGFAVDLRSRLDSSFLGNFCYDSAMVYEKEWLDKPLEEQLRLVRASLKSALDTDSMVSNIKLQEDSAGVVINVMPPKSEKMAEILKDKIGRHETTYFISNIGEPACLRDVADYLEDFGVISTPFLNTVDYIMCSFGGRGRIVEEKNYTGSKVILRLKDMLLELGMESVHREIGLYESDRLDVSLFKNKDEVGE